MLFLDEFPLFRHDVVEAMREPLENGEITVARAEELVTLPARGIVVLAANPCPCGDHKPHAKDDRCRCRPQALREYRAKLSGPVADRIDIVRHVEPLAAHERADRFAPREDSATVRARVARARARQAERYAESGWRLNGHATGAALRDHWPLTDAATEAKILIERWRREYNTVRPHSALGYRPPAPAAISPVSLNGLIMSPALS